MSGGLKNGYRGYPHVLGCLLNRRVDKDLYKKVPELNRLGDKRGNSRKIVSSFYLYLL